MMIIHQFRPWRPGGAEVQAERLAERLAQRGHDVHVLTQQRTPDALPVENWSGFRITRVPFALGYRPFSGWNQFAFLVRYRRSYDILHVHQAFGHAVVAVLAAQLLRKPCLIKLGCAGTYGDLHQFSRLPLSAFGLPILRQADAIVAISREIEQELRTWQFPTDRILCLPNGIDTSRFQRSARWAKPDKERRPWRLCLVGRRHPQKGIDVAIRAMALLRQESGIPTCELHLYGVDYPEYDFRRLSAACGVEDRVIFHDFRDEPRAILDTHDLFILPSRGEGLSNALLEAMSMELPIIATRVSGTSDLLVDGWNGRLIPPESPEALCTAIVDVMRRPEQAEEWGRRARRTVESLYSMDYIAAQYSALYDRLLARLQQP